MAPLPTCEIRRAAWSRLSPAERAALTGRGFTRAELTAFEGVERCATLALAARLAAPGEDVRARAAERLAVAWRRYLAARWARVDRFAGPPEKIENLNQALHRLTLFWRGQSLEADTIARFIRGVF